jgi:hypothetical protein
MRQLSDLAGVPPAVSGATAVMLRVPHLHGDREHACATLSMAGNPTGVVAVVYRGTGEEWLDRLHGHRGSPETTRVVTVGDAMPAVGARADEVRSVENPDDLTGVEIAVGEALSALPEGRSTLCFDSLTALLQYADVEDAYRLLHPLIERCHAEGVVAHLHVDPGAHEDRTLAALAGVLDATVELGADGAIEVRTTVGVGPTPSDDG